MTMRMRMRMIVVLVMVAAIGGLVYGNGATREEQKLQEFIEAHISKIKPLYKAANLAYWDAATTGKPEYYKKVSELQIEIRRIYSNAAEFGFLKGLKESGQVKDALLARQLERLYNAYLENQIEPQLMERIVKLGTETEEKFSTFRGKIDGREVTDNQIREILKKEADSEKRKKAWLASKEVGDVVSANLVELVKLRNEGARKVGFENYHLLSLAVGEQDATEVDRIFDELYEATKEPYARLKAEVDEALAKKYGVSVGELRPWHYQDPFFQESPTIYDVDLGMYYEGKDVREIATRFYEGIGLPVESILAKSDLYEHKGKNPHAFCTDIDREGDVRVLCNLKNNEQWMETILHELGHGVYDKYHDLDVPYLLREPAHIFTTEGMAMFFGRLCDNAAWMQQMLGLTDEQKGQIEKVSGRYERLKQLIFVRWATVMYEFEKRLYANPEADLNKLWWELVEKYQFVKRPEGREEPDWAAKIHFTTSPCYYHNYVLGELFASQMEHYIVREVLKEKAGPKGPKGAGAGQEVSYVNQPKVGEYLRERIFEEGAVYHWKDMIKRATGEPLTVKYFVDEFVK